MATYKQLLAEKKALEEKLAEVRANEIAGVIEQIRALMAEYDLSVDDLAPRKRGRPAGSKTRHSEPLPPKYRDPKTGATWSGRGRAPAWLGKNRARFLIQDAE
ncbi:DNA-binding protein [Cupriavidus sp. USMAA2-4]|uniref:DNA-binding protein n=1 Tax=Cupriavidus malaysiensis TaxID=367825 RepID=A0ABM6FE44_9BURK|nr:MULTISPECIES: H-NS histone family protein [Cupriavidus]AOY94623.1 DNA-binding protein [Cupriavidus sp. USMAA2-4]AOZ10119.1 DNA-binding protein [Cupriavidus malaysiensis]